MGKDPDASRGNYGRAGREASVEDEPGARSLERGSNVRRIGPAQDHKNARCQTRSKDKKERTNKVDPGLDPGLGPGLNPGLINKRPPMSRRPQELAAEALFGRLGCHG